MSKQKHHSVMFFRSEGAKARSIASELFTKQNDYATRVGNEKSRPRDK